MSGPTKASEDDPLPAILALVLLCLRPFVAAAVLQTAYGWHFGGGPSYWTFFAVPFVLSAMGVRARSPNLGYWPNQDFFLHVVLSLGLALGVAWGTAP